MSEIGYRVTALNPALRQIAGKAIVEKYAARIAYNAAQMTLTSARAHVPIDSSVLVGSGEIIGTGSSLQVVFSAPYASYVHGPMNRSSSRTDPHFPPIQAVQAWADRRGIPAYLIARAIARQGTAYHPFLADAVDEIRASELPDIVNSAMQDLREELQQAA